jgi:hypothetical protein
MSVPDAGRAHKQLQQASEQWDDETRNYALRDFCFDFYVDVLLFSAMLLQTKNRFELFKPEVTTAFTLPKWWRNLCLLMYLFTDFNSFGKNWLESESCSQAGKEQAPTNSVALVC